MEEQLIIPYHRPSEVQFFQVLFDAVFNYIKRVVIILHLYETFRSWFTKKKTN